MLEDKALENIDEWPEDRCDYYYNLIYKLRTKTNILTTYYTYVAFNYNILQHMVIIKSYELMKKLRDQCIMNEVIFVHVV